MVDDVVWFGVRIALFRLVSCAEAGRARRRRSLRHPWFRGVPAGPQRPGVRADSLTFRHFAEISALTQPSRQMVGCSSQCDSPWLANLHVLSVSTPPSVLPVRKIATLAQAPAWRLLALN